ncbi:hypothetical protein ACFFIX_19840 [Metabacillus herbersteinensis]|uniref:Homing endonuclease LAGLIDADG domain-containing protein n=1 Tax=Metabacillus herbersteinensis TaxID=283816 RepID=A0ABV6GIX1_9BACI
MGKSFHVIKPRTTKSDFYYKVYVTNTYFYFIKIGSQFHNRYAYDKQLPDILEFLFWFLFKKVEQKQADLEIEYDEKISSGQVSGLLQKKHNFSINNTGIKDIVINQKGILHTGFSRQRNHFIYFNKRKNPQVHYSKTTLRSSVTDALRKLNNHFKEV